MRVHDRLLLRFSVSALPFFLLPVIHAQPASQLARQGAPVLRIEGLANGTVPLDGKWQFHLGDNMAWASPAFDDSGWEQLTADRPWGAQGHRGYTGMAWYRLHIAVDPVRGAPPDLALLIPSVDDAYELYWNGRFVSRLGKLPPHPVWYFQYPPQTYGLGVAREGVLALRVWEAPLVSWGSDVEGGFEALPVLGSPEGIENLKGSLDHTWLRSNQFRFAESLFYLLIGLLSLGAWLRDRRQRLLFWMAGFALAPPLIVLNENYLQTLWPFNVLASVEGWAVALSDISLWFLLVLLLRLDHYRRLVRGVRAAAWLSAISYSLDGVVVLLWGSAVPALPLQIADGVLTFLYKSLEVLPAVLVVFALLRQKRLDFARWLVAICAFAFGMSQSLWFVANQGIRFTHWTLFYRRIRAPLFTLNGNEFTLLTLAGAMLLVAIVYAVVLYTIDHHRRQIAIEQEMEQARQVQQVLIPEAEPQIPGFEIHSEYRPARQVGGDFFQVLPLEGGVLAVIGDVSGKGMPAAMAVALIVGAVRALAEDHAAPAELLARLNRRLTGRLRGGFATCEALRISSGGQCRLASAGHPAPMLNGRELALPAALPLCIAADVRYTEIEFALAPGDHLALYTDGLLEARNPSGELYGFERVGALFAERPEARRAAEAAVNFGQDDDITVLTLTRQEIGAEVRRAQATAAL